jgi:phosphatidate phosphatase APP1
MTDWRDDLRHLARDLGTHARRVVRAVDRGVEREPLHIAGYRAYATHWRALAVGRAVRDEGRITADASHRGWQNLLNLVRRLESDPYPHATVRASIGGAQQTITADDEGFFRQWIKCDAPLTDAQWHAVELELVHDALPSPVRSTSRVLVPSPRAAFGVISDMDDTVLQSEVGTFLRAARLMLLENSRTRLPFPGVAAFYRALESGHGLASGVFNPIFYVSSSPWNLYDVIADFLDAQKIPEGPLQLRDWDWSSALEGHRTHKSTLIREILDAYPWMSFILIGDSGQEDPEIYARLVHEYRGRIVALYIRDVSRSAVRTAAIDKLATEVASTGCTLVLGPDTVSMARHAAEHGWIDPARLAEIGEEKRADE